MFRTFIASQFKKPTGLFGRFTSNIMIKGNRKNYERLIKELDIQPQDKILEIGYGPGEGIHMIVEANPTCTIHGIDFSPLMYKRARKLNHGSIDRGALRLQQGDFLKTSIAERNYDKIFCLNVVYFWNPLKEPFEKVLSLLKKGGTFHIYMADRNALIKMKTPDSIFNKYAIEKVVDMLRSAGFEEVTYFFENGYYIKARK